MTENSANKVVDIAQRVKGAALLLIGGVLLFFAIDNYLRVSNAQIGTTIRMPRILEWSYDTLGLVPSVILQSILALVIMLIGIRMLVVGKRLSA